jgi:hypothetical protein
MSREEFEAIVSSVAEYFPSEEVAMTFWRKYKIRDASAVVKGLKRNKLYKQYWPTVMPIIARCISDIPAAQLGKDLIAIIDMYYPDIIRDIIESDAAGDRSAGDLLKAVILMLIEEVKS